MKRKTKDYILLIFIILAIILLDQTLKLFLQNTGEITLIQGAINLNVYNQSTDSTYIITILIIILIIFKFIISQNEFVTKKMKIFLSFILAGGISNIIDRIIRGYVIEYIHFRTIINLPIFNIADIFVIIGWICVISIFTGFTFNELKNRK